MHYRGEGLKERVTSSSGSSLVSLGQSETHSAGGLRKHEDGGGLHSKARARGLQLPGKSERAQSHRVTDTQEQWGETREETVIKREGEKKKKKGG